MLPLTILWFAGLGAAGQFAKYSVPFDALSAAYPDAGAALGPIVSVISAMGVICGFFAGLLAARLGYRRVLIWALWGGAVLAAVQVVMPPVPLLLGLRFLEGIPHLVIVVAAPTLMAQISPERARPSVMTVWSTFFGVTFALTAWFGAPLVAAMGLEALLLAHAMWMALVAILITLVLAPLPTTTRTHEPFSISGIASAHLAAYRSPAKSAPALGWLCYTLTYVSLLTVLPQQLQDADRVWASALMPLAGLLVSLTVGMAALRILSGVSLVMLGFSLGLIGAALLSRDPSNAYLAIGLMACLGLVQSGSFAAIPQLVQSAADQAQANGAMAQMGNLGNLLGTPILLILLGAGGAQGIYWGLFFAYGVGLALHLWQQRRRRRGVT
ncbi:MFS transporter [Roseobacteraceae bacterium S113]